MSRKNILRGISANVIVLGFVSFLTDVSSDMIYPLLPLFLVQYVGASHGFIGLVEGIAESTAAFFTLISGFWADRMKDRTRLILGGYSISSFSRPLVAIAQSPWVVLFVRFFDRVGKGIRTSPRDALIADSVASKDRGKAYGFHRSMDHAGAVAGPLIASLLLLYFTENLRVVFWFAAIPGFLSLILILWKVREVEGAKTLPQTAGYSLQFPHGKLRIYLAILFVFMLSCSSDAFLLLRAQQLGVSKPLIPILWMVFSIIKAVTTFPLGILSDRLGRRKVILAGWIVYTLVYCGFAAASSPAHVWILFCCYGLFYGLTEGGERAILADYAQAGERGKAFGWYYFVTGLGVLPASLLFGWVWQTQGASTAFFLSAGISAIASFLLYLFLRIFPSPQKTVLIKEETETS